MDKRKSGVRSERGFTMIEMLGVGAIIAILAAVSVPTILGAINKSKVNAATDSLSQMAGALHRYYAAQTDANTNPHYPTTATQVSSEAAWTALSTNWANGFWNTPTSPNYSFGTYITDGSGTKFCLGISAKDSATTSLMVDDNNNIAKGSCPSPLS